MSTFFKKMKREVENSSLYRELRNGINNVKDTIENLVNEIERSDAYRKAKQLARQGIADLRNELNQLENMLNQGLNEAKQLFEDFKHTLNR